MKVARIALLAASTAISFAAPAAESAGVPGSPAAEERLAYADYQQQLDRLLAGGVQADAGALAAVPAPLTSTPEPVRCSLFVSGRESATAEDCLSCHELHRSHRVDFAYPAASRSNSLRSAEEAVRRGVFLPGGMVRCATCHEARSPYRYHLAIPVGAKLHRGVNPRDPETWRSKDGASALETSVRDVSPTPLCQVCHSYGD